MITVLAPAKLNLTLEVLAKRADGYHEIRSIMQSVSLRDTLRFSSAAATTIRSESEGWLPDLSLVSKGVGLVRQETGGRQEIDIKIEKRIPLMSGLGGDSSDAAATLLGLNEVWKLGLSPARLMDLAARLGSDVPFFVRGGTARAEGRGEILNALPDLLRVWFVIVVPRVAGLPGKTARLYAALDSTHYTGGRGTDTLASCLEENRPIGPDMLFNTFENVAFDVFPGLGQSRDRLAKLGADNIHLAGSGPALFSMLADRERARDLHRRCRDEDLEAYLAEPMSRRMGPGLPGSPPVGYTQG